jgi:iron complex outermembrane receptor protein
VRYKPIAKLEVNVLYQDFKSDRGTWLQVAGTGYQGPSTPPAGVAAVPANFNGPAISPFDRQSVISTIGIRNEHHQNLIGEFDLDLGSYHLGYVGQYTKTRNRNNGSGDVGHVDPIALPGLQSLDGRSVLRTHELRVETTGDRFWDYGAGLYYESTNSQNLVESFATFLPGTWGNPRGARSLANFNLNYNLILTGNFPTSWENKAIYANSTWHLTPRTELFAGLRYINYTQSSDQIGTLSSGLTATGLPVAFCGLIPSQGAGPAFPSTIIPGQCDVALPARTLFTSNPLVGSFKPSVYSASLTHHFTDDLTAYVSYGHSWRAGTNNLNLSSTDPRIVAFFTTRPETSENYEAGVKTQLLDRKLTLNVAAFYQVYKDYQYSSLGVPYINNTGAALSVATAASLAVNADGKVQGIDFELAYQPNRHFSISGSFNYARGRLSNALVPCNDSNFDGIPDSGVATVAGFQAAGAAVAYCRSSDALARQADWNASVQSEYNMPVSGNTDAYIRALGTYTPSTPFAPTGLTTDSYALINLYLGARGHDGRWDVGGYARNLTNTEKLLTQGASPIGTPADAQTALGLASSTGYRIVSVTPRREFGVTLRYSW